jgi:hypothetical protein
MDKKYIYPLTAIVCSVILGGSFIGAQLSRQSSIEEQQMREIEAAKQERAEESIKESTKKIILDECLADAYDTYRITWLDKCESEGKLSLECIRLKDITYSQYKKDWEDENPEYSDLEMVEFDMHRFIELNYKTRLDECNCNLYESQYSVIEERYSIEKEECFKKNPVD